MKTWERRELLADRLGGGAASLASVIICGGILNFRRGYEKAKLNGKCHEERTDAACCSREFCPGRCEEAGKSNWQVCLASCLSSQRGPEAVCFSSRRSEFSGAVREERAGVSRPTHPQLRPAAAPGLDPAPRATTRCCGGSHGDPGLSGAPQGHVGSDSRHDCKNNSEMLNCSALFWYEF